MSELDDILGQQAAPAPAIELKNTLGNRVTLLENRLGGLERAITAGFSQLQRQLTERPAPAPQPIYYPPQPSQPQQSIDTTLSLIKSIFDIQAKAKESIREDLELAAQWGAPPVKEEDNLGELLKLAPMVLSGQKTEAPAPSPPPAPSPSPSPEVK